MRSPLLAALTAALIALPLTPGAVAAEPAAKADPVTTTTTEQALAEQALDRALALSTDLPDAAARRQGAVSSRPDATMLLNQVMRTRGDLAPEDRARADALLARPTKPGGDGLLDYGSAPHARYCDEVICIHYVTDGSDDHAPNLTDERGEPAPDAVEDALTRARHVHDTYTGSGYRRPDSDGSRGGGGTGRVDIYMGDIGDQGIYGYCASDQPEKSDGTYNYWAYCAIDNDYRPGQFPTNTPTENQQVTLAHEYFHAVQFAYDAAEDSWFMEATATWAEEQLYDGVNDNRFYLRHGQLRRPRLPLDEFGDSLAAYGQWIFFQYLTQRWRARTGSLPRIMLEMWRKSSGRAAAPDMFSTQAIHRTLAARNAPFTRVYGQFAADNRHPARTYAEGHAPAYRNADPRMSFTLGRKRRRSGQRRTHLDHLTHQTMRYRTGKGIGGPGWRLKLAVDLADRATAPVARLVIKKENGRVVERSIRLSRRGAGRTTVPFRGSRVRFVELVLVNASRRTECWTGGGSTEYACDGSPRDDFRRAAFRGWLVRS